MLSAKLLNFMEGNFSNINTVPFRVDKVQIFDKKPPKEDPNATIKNAGTS